MQISHQDPTQGGSWKAGPGEASLTRRSAWRGSTFHVYTGCTGPRPEIKCSGLQGHLTSSGTGQCDSIINHKRAACPHPLALCFQWEQSFISDLKAFFFFLAATCDISLCILTGGLCVCTRGERQVHICSMAGTPPPRPATRLPSPNGGGFWREVGLLKSFCLSEFCLNAFSSAVHVFLLHLEKKVKVAEGGEGTRAE